MPSSGIVAIDPSNNDTAVIDASTLSAAPEECPSEQHETAEELSQEDEDDQPAVSPMPPHKKAPMVTPRTDRKVTTSPSAGGGSSGNAPHSSHTPESSKGKSKKKVAVATPVAADESTPKKSKKSSKAKSVPMKTMKHFFGKAGTAKAKKGNAKSSAANSQKKKDDKQSKKVVDTSLAEPSADSTGEDESKAKAENVSTTKKGKAKTKAKPKQLPKNPPAKKKAKATPKSLSVDIISLEDMDDSPMDALAIVSRNMSSGVESSEGKVEDISESDDDATVAMDDVAVESDSAAPVEKDNFLSESPVCEVKCTEEVMCDVESDKGTSTEEKDEESPKGQPAKRDPNAPKKPKSALNMYQIAKRNEFKAANPDTKAGEIVSVVDIDDDLSCNFYALTPFDSF
ncbi:hypothetical protein QTG54_013659 [Skeletonema marinoi]|uniref:Uncharacterized protein n=1 Tax=Skeletonema marinoi TaxID=267567 RepID=A0AAD8XY84_9STRA|nr:hypothetical protein QTG54_013659 [Skeletonema marinoi]